MQEAAGDSMKCTNIRIEDEVIRFDCPHCGVDAEIDEPTLKAFWEQKPDGHFPCPEPEGCGHDLVLPTLEEIELRKTVVPPPVGAYHPDPEQVNTPPKAKPIQEKTPAELAAEMLNADQEPEKEHTNGHAAATALAIRTFRHSDWQGGGQDNFDREVSKFLAETGEANIISVNPISYTDGDAKLNDYGVMVVFKRQQTGETEWDG
ncbi:MAG: hypothetical protein CMO74_11080 [Verrucomicrobiales bacterium]|nr:hypothetical protein [Verrucomicrobiales bacterium]|tara:strand:+ start:3237 stop:3851 length:615 start_codon:yes stop_codon:yes gene_type:complete